MSAETKQKPFVGAEGVFFPLEKHFVSFYKNKYIYYQIKLFDKPHSCVPNLSFSCAHRGLL